jgi:hypothetical protein
MERRRTPDDETDAALMPLHDRLLAAGASGVKKAD